MHRSTQPSSRPYPRLSLAVLVATVLGGCAEPPPEAPEPSTAAATAAPSGGRVRQPASRDRGRSSVTAGVAAVGDDFTIWPTVLKAGVGTTGTVTLGNPAPAGGVTVLMHVSNPSFLSVPTTFIVPAGQTSADVTISPTSVPPPGDFQVTVSASFQAATHSVDLILIAPVAGNAQFSLPWGAPLCPSQVASCDTGSIISGRSNMWGGREVNAPNTVTTACVDGTDGTYHFDESLEGLKVATVDGTPLAPGKMVTVTAKVYAYFDGSSDTLDVFSSPDGGLNWFLMGTARPPSGGINNLSVSFNLPMTTEPVEVIRAQFRYNGIASPCSDGTYDDRDDLVFAVAPLTVSLQTPLLRAGVSTTGTVSLPSPAVSNQTVTLTSNNPSLVTIPASVTIPAGFRSATFNVGTNAAAARTDVTISAKVGTIAPVTTFLAIYPLQTTGNAVFDATLKAPKCASTGASCDSGRLLDGRHTLLGGPESNAPNTIGGTCPDGSDGAYRRDESLDRLKVSSVDGAAIAGGKSVRIDATVFAFDTGKDKLDLFQAPDASNPLWSLIGTFSPSATGVQTISTTFTLTATGGTLRAIRGVYRFNGTVSACGASTYDDTDDLIFAVPGGTPSTQKIYLEAEAASPLPMPMQLGTDAQASGGKFIQVQAGKNSTGGAPTDGRAKLTFTAPAAGSYKVWGRVKAPDTGSDSFWVRFDGAGTWINWGLAADPAWHWVQVPGPGSNGTFTFTAAGHNMEVAYREDGAQLDRVLITNNLTFVPSGVGQ